MFTIEFDSRLNLQSYKRCQTQGHIKRDTEKTS